MTHVFSVPLALDPPTANSRLHWARRATITRRIRADCGVIARSERIRLGVADARKATSGPRRVHLTFVRPGQRGAHPVDGDALPAKGKPVLDALKDAGWLLDDAEGYVSTTYSQERGHQLAVRVEVTV